MLHISIFRMLLKMGINPTDDTKKHNFKIFLSILFFYYIAFNVFMLMDWTFEDLVQNDVRFDNLYRIHSLVDSSSLFPHFPTNVPPTPFVATHSNPFKHGHEIKWISVKGICPCLTEHISPSCFSLKHLFIKVAIFKQHSSSSQSSLFKHKPARRGWTIIYSPLIEFEHFAGNS